MPSALCVLTVPTGKNTSPGHFLSCFYPHAKTPSEHFLSCFYPRAKKQNKTKNSALSVVLLPTGKTSSEHFSFCKRRSDLIIDSILLVASSKVNTLGALSVVILPTDRRTHLLNTFCHTFLFVFCFVFVFLPTGKTPSEHFSFCNSYEF